MPVRLRSAVAALALVGALLPSPVLAHAILLSSSPAAGGTVAAGPAEMTLRFNSRIDRARSLLRLTRPDRSQSTLPIADDGPPDVLTTRAELAPGRYSLRWQVLAIDGHITRGDVVFTASPAP